MKIIFEGDKMIVTYCGYGSFSDDEYAIEGYLTQCDPIYYKFGHTSIIGIEMREDGGWHVIINGCIERTFELNLRREAMRGVDIFITDLLVKFGEKGLGGPL